ncbi:MAG: aspartate/glutamate racemase family protein [Acuticoccus sp.]
MRRRRAIPAHGGRTTESPPMRLLIANPNTSDAMTALMVAEARALCRPATEIVGVTARTGVPYIATRAETALAASALLETLAQTHQSADAVVVGAFCPGLAPPPRELLPLPVVGLAEAGLRSAMHFGRRVGIVGVGTRERGMNEEIVREVGMERDVVAIERLPLTGTEILADPDAADEAAVAAGLRAVADGADVLVLGGAAFSGAAARIGPRLPVPVIAPLAFAIALAEMAVLTGWRKPTAGTFSRPRYGPLEGRSDALAALFRQDG